MRYILTNVQVEGHKDVVVVAHVELEQNLTDELNANLWIRAMLTWTILVVHMRKKIKF